MQNAAGSFKCIDDMLQPVNHACYTRCGLGVASALAGEMVTASSAGILLAVATSAAVVMSVVDPLHTHTSRSGGYALIDGGSSGCVASLCFDVCAPFLLIW